MYQYKCTTIPNRHPCLPKLNPQQLAAVKTIDHPLLVLASAGSDKTRVITEKIAYLAQHGTPARHIAALTFTNKAAREMKSRLSLSRLLDDKQSRSLRVSWRDGFCKPVLNVSNLSWHRYLA